MSMQAQFAPMTVEDIDQITTAEASLQEQPWTPGNFIDSLNSGHDCRLMRVDHALAGYAITLFVLDEAHLLTIGVLKAAQGKGYGRQLLGHLLDVARARLARVFFLEVRQSNEAALGLYRSVGFEKIGVRKGYYPALEGREDAIVMRLDLS